MAAPIADLRVQVSASSAPLAAGLRKAGDELRRFRDQVANARPAQLPPPDLSAVKKAHADARRLAAQARPPADHQAAFRRAADQARGSASAAAAGMARFAAQAAATGGGLVLAEAGVAGLAGAFEQLKGSVGMAAEFEQTKLGFEVMLGSAEQAGKMVADLRKYAATTPFNTREVTASARQLVAYGSAAGDVMPTLKMLGDVSAGFGKDLPLGELTYLFGTLQSQGRAYTKDLQQFAGRGIPIWDELAKATGKNVVELHALVEEGRIASDDVTAAFKRMTGEGGRFYKMTERQADTLAGQWEQLKDALDLTKLEFGRVLIDELGLKDAAKDAERFAGRIRAAVDEVRPAVRFVGQLGRAAAQVGQELVRAAIPLARVGVNALTAAFPGIKQAAAEIEQALAGAAEWKIDTRKLVAGAYDFGEALAVGLAQAGRQAAAFGDAFVNGFVVPMLRSVKATAEAIQQLSEQVRAVNEARQDPKKLLLPGALALSKGTPAGMLAERFARGPAAGPAADVATYRRAVDQVAVHRQELEHAQRAGRPAEAEQASARLRESSARLQEVLGSFPGVAPDDARAALQAGRSPAGGDWVDEIAKAMRAGIAAFPAPSDDEVRNEIRRLRDAHQGELAPKPIAPATSPDYWEEVRRLRREVAGMAVGGGLFPTGGPARTNLPPLQNYAETIRRSQQELAGMAMAGGLYPAGMAGIDRENERLGKPARPEVMQAALDARKRYDPGPEFRARQANLDEAKKRGILSPDHHALASRDLMKELADQFELNQPAQLAPAAGIDTEAGARIVTAYLAQPTKGGGPGQPANTVEGLLRQIYTIQQQQLAALNKLPGGGPAAKPQDVRVMGMKVVTMP